MNPKSFPSAHQTPPGLPARLGDLPPLNARFAAFLDKSDGQRTRRQLVVSSLLAALGLMLLLLLLFMGFVKRMERAWTYLPLGMVLLVQGGRQIQNALSRQKKQGETGRVVRNGVPVTAFLVQANQALFSPGPFTSLPCLVLFSFQPEVGGDADYMEFLSQKLFGYKNNAPATAEGQSLSLLTSDEKAVHYRRRKLPLSFTDGSTVYCADLWIKRAYIPSGHLQSRKLTCLAEPGETGGLELVPSFLQ